MLRKKSYAYFCNELEKEKKQALLGREQSQSPPYLLAEKNMQTTLYNKVVESITEITNSQLAKVRQAFDSSTLSQKDKIITIAKLALDIHRAVWFCFLAALTKNQQNVLLNQTIATYVKFLDIIKQDSLQDPMMICIDLVYTIEDCKNKILSLGERAWQISTK